MNCRSSSGLLRKLAKTHAISYLSALLRMSPQRHITLPGLPDYGAVALWLDMTKIFIAIAAVIIVLGGVLYMLGRGNNSPAPQVPQGNTTQQVATTSYSGNNFSITYQTDFLVDPAFSNEEVNPAKPISGVKFSIPEIMATGTNLASDTFLSVEWLPKAKNCTGDIYIRDNVRPQEVTDGMTVYSLASTSGAAAGNRYEEMVYALPNSSPCTAVRYSIHYSEISNYPPGTVQEFDRAKLLSIFDDMRRSLMLTAAAAPAVSSPMQP